MIARDAFRISWGVCSDSIRFVAPSMLASGLRISCARLADSWPTADNRSARLICSKLSWSSRFSAASSRLCFLPQWAPRAHRVALFFLLKAVLEPGFESRKLTPLLHPTVGQHPGDCAHQEEH